MSAAVPEMVPEETATEEPATELTQTTNPEEPEAPTDESNTDTDTAENPALAPSSEGTISISPGPSAELPPEIPEVENCLESPVPQAIIALSDYQLVNGIRIALGEAALTAANLPAAEQKQFSRPVPTLSSSEVITRMGWAEDAGNSLTGRVAEVTQCQESDRACAQIYLENLARFAFRRAVSAEEVGALMAVFDVGNAASYERGVGLAVEAIFSAPSHLYRTALGEPAEARKFRLTPTEFASELSYLLTDAPPDAALLESAIGGTLGDPAVAAAQVERLLNMLETQTQLTSTLMAAWSFNDLAGVVKDGELFPEFGALRPKMYRETKLFLQDVLWARGVDVSAILTSPVTFVDGSLAALYGVPFPGTDTEAFVQVTLPAEQRAGILTQASVMSARSDPGATSVVSRGLFVRNNLLCLPLIPGEPDNGILTPPQQDPEATPRERLAFRLTTDICSTCHSQIDILGLPLEFYDPIGRYLPETTDTTVSLAEIVGLTATEPTVSNGVELAQTLATAPQFKSCITRHMLSYGLGSNDLLATSCEVRDIVETFPEVATMTDILRAVASSEALWIRSGGL